MKRNVPVVRLIIATRSSSILINGKIIKEMPCSVASGTLYSYWHRIYAPCPLYPLCGRLNGSQKLSAIEHQSTNLTTTADINLSNASAVLFPEIKPLFL
jgi:hypothetical protein